jgi:hypothetical protein
MELKINTVGALVTFVVIPPFLESELHYTTLLNFVLLAPNTGYLIDQIC